MSEIPWQLVALTLKTLKKSKSGKVLNVKKIKRTFFRCVHVYSWKLWLRLVGGCRRLWNSYCQYWLCFRSIYRRNRLGAHRLSITSSCSNTQKIFNVTWITYWYQYPIPKQYTVQSYNWTLWTQMTVSQCSKPGLTVN